MNKILVANRGEIALSAIRCIREMGMSSVAIFSEVDENSLHIRYADEVRRLPGAHPLLNYASVSRLVETAINLGADAIYPGYGFLSESPDLARACRDKGITFIGPTAEVLERSRNKVGMIQRARELGIAVVDHSEPVQGEADLLEKAQQIGFPVLIKPVSGSGGRFLAKAYKKEELLEFYRGLVREQEIQGPVVPFYLEHYIRRGIHLEFPVLADADGHVIHLGDRECVIQRRFQKLIAETPSMLVSESAKREMGEAAVKLVRDLGLQGCCSVEFLVDHKGRWFFMEVNPRIQVEYALTEITYGVELIKEQIRIASGESLKGRFDDLQPRFHSIECRINAEDPTRDFRPSTGAIHEYYIPGGFGYSVLSSVSSGHRVEIYYDPMILKLNCFAPTRDEALAKLGFVLDAIRLKGVKTNIPLLRRIVASDDFENFKLRLDFRLKDFLPQRSQDRQRQEIAAIVAALDHEVVGRYRTKTVRRERIDENIWNLSGRIDLMNRRTL